MNKKKWYWFLLFIGTGVSSLFYSIAISIRHFLYDKGWLVKTTRFNFPMITVGNLSMGGTGKTPMISFLIDLLKQDYQVATLSRGYKRKTKGYIDVHIDSDPVEVGDEAYWMKQMHPDVVVAVGENRRRAVVDMLEDHPFLEIILLDDAFQHRAIEVAFNIILTDYNHLFYEDQLFPLGTLRDKKNRIKKAQIVVVTKTPLQLSKQGAEEIATKIQQQSEHAHIFFTSIVYRSPYHILSSESIDLNELDSILLVTGIAKPVYLIEYLSKYSIVLDHLKFPDHHIFSMNDFLSMGDRFAKLKGRKIILTTEKDSVRLKKIDRYWQQLPMYVMPISMQFHFKQEGVFVNEVKHYVNQYLD